MKQTNFLPLLFNQCCWLLVLLLVTACSKSYEELSMERAATALEAQQNKEDIMVGVVWPNTKWADYFVDGVNLAISELNAGGGVRVSNQCQICEQAYNACNQCSSQNIQCDECELNQQLCDTCKRQEVSNGSKWGYRQLTSLLEEQAYSKPPSPTTRNAEQLLALKNARPFINNLEVVAVIGHPFPSEAVPASVIYQNYGILFLAAGTIESVLTQPGFSLTFRTIPDTRQMADQLAGFCALYQHYQRIVILHLRNTYGEELADSFAKSAADLGIQIVHKGSFFPDTQNYKELIASFQKKTFDAIFLAAWDEDAALLVRQAREMEITQPFIGTEGITKLFIETVGEALAEGMTTPTCYKPAFNKAAPFIKHYKETYNNDDPTVWAALGYDNIKLLAHAIELANSTVPSVLATTLRYMKPWIGITGVHAFDEHGEIKGKQYSFQVIDHGKFEPLPTAHLPYLFYKLDHRSTFQTNTEQ